MLSHRTAVTFGAIIASLTLTGCGDDLFSNMNGTAKANSAPPTTAENRSPSADSPPNYGDNSRVHRPGAMTRADEQAATSKAEDVRSALEEQQKRGSVSLTDVQPILEAVAAPGRVDVTNRTTGISATVSADGSTFGIYVGESACITGAVTRTRIWINVNGHYAETGCIEPPTAH
ncbi:hypothetical protein [Streptomyces sp. NPDC048224]|uniref:hypothetical protein n=1 Tax=Streptomyces sp. NPDC048224 TaxID=3154500 RepID=UPI0033DE0015